MQHLLEKNGFVRCGNITLADGTSRIAYHALCRRAGANSKLLPRLPQRWPRQPKLCPNQPTARCWLHWMAAAPAGKTTIAAQMARQYGWGVVHLDDFFLQPIQRTPQRMAEPAATWTANA